MLPHLTQCLGNFMISRIVQVVGYLYTARPERVGKNLPFPCLFTREQGTYRPTQGVLSSDSRAIGPKCTAVVHVDRHWGIVCFSSHGFGEMSAIVPLKATPAGRLRCPRSDLTEGGGTSEGDSAPCGSSNPTQRSLSATKTWRACGEASTCHACPESRRCMVLGNTGRTWVPECSRCCLYRSGLTRSPLLINLQDRNQT